MSTNGLPPDLAALLEAERSRPIPSPTETEQALERLHRALRSPPPLLTATPDIEKSRLNRGSLVRRLAGPAVGVLIGVGIGYVAGTRAAPESAIPSATPSSVVPNSAGSSTQEIPAETPSTAAGIPAVVDPDHSSTHAQAGPPATAHPGLRTRATPPPSPASSLRDERILLERARSALLRGDRDAALAAVQLHEARFPDGQLEQEREALRQQATSANPVSSGASP